MARPRLQPCDRPSCASSARHGWVRGLKFYCSLACLTLGPRR